MPHEEAIVLGILEILSGRKLYKIDDSQVPDGDNAQNYRINEDGHISHIFIWEESILFEFFPEQLCELVYLEELHIEPTAIIKLPESLSKLKKLRILSLSNFYEYIGRSEELSIPESIFPFLRKLKDFSFDSDLLKKLGLKE